LSALVANANTVGQFTANPTLSRASAPSSPLPILERPTEMARQATDMTSTTFGKKTSWRYASVATSRMTAKPMPKKESGTNVKLLKKSA